MVIRAVRPLVAEPPAPEPHPQAAPAAGELLDERGQGVQVATIARLAAAGEDVLVVVADTARRQAMLASVLHPGRFGGGGIALAAWSELPRAAEGFRELVLLDPPPAEQQLELLRPLAGDARTHVVWGTAEITFARSVAEHQEPLRPALAAVWKAARDGVTPLLDPATITRCMRVLDELGLDPAAPPQTRVDLEASASYRAAQQRFQDALAFLDRLESGQLELAPVAEPVAVAS